MNIEQLHRMLSFGNCSKEDGVIGRYGNGFKSGSMRIASDALVFSRSDNLFILGLLSQTFLVATKATKVLVPIVSWDATTHGMCLCCDVLMLTSPFRLNINRNWICSKPGCDIQIFSIYNYQRTFQSVFGHYC